jgi:hypothetical protein
MDKVNEALGVCPSLQKRLSRCRSLSLSQLVQNRKEDIVSKVGLKIEYGIELKQPEDRGDYKTIGDKEHIQIIALYAEGNGYSKIHDKLNRSTKSLHDHIHKHNDAVNRSGFCAICRRVGGEFSREVVIRKKKEPL